MSKITILLTRFNEVLKQFMPFLILIAILIEGFNVVYLFHLKSEIKSVEEQVTSISYGYRQRRFPTDLPSIKQQIDDAEAEITRKIEMLYYYR